jgi:hypothetical protein
MVVPLRPLSEVGRAIPRLMPVVRVEGRDFVVLPTEIATAHRAELDRVLGNLEPERYRLIGLVDYLLTGY